jgi:hypothetical protein
LQPDKTDFLVDFCLQEDSAVLLFNFYI